MGLAESMVVDVELIDFIPGMGITETERNQREQRATK